MSQQWNLTVERELSPSTVARVSYRGIRGTQLPYGADINKPPASAIPAGRNFFRYPNFYSVVFNQSGGIQNLHALDVTVERKFGRGLTFQSSWTWAHNLTDATSDGEGADNTIQDAFNRRAEYGNVDYMPRHRWVSYAQYELPFGKGKRFGSDLPRAVDHIFGNWEITGVTLFQSGRFLTPSFSGSDPSNTRSFGGRPDRVGSSTQGQRTIANWFNPAAFAVPPVGRFGNAANGSLEGPGLKNFDFGLYKYFTIKEKVRAQIRMTSTNFLNHPNFGNPNTNISSSSVGRITSLQGGRRDTLGSGPREIELGVRFEF